MTEQQAPFSPPSDNPTPNHAPEQSNAPVEEAVSDVQDEPIEADIEADIEDEDDVELEDVDTDRPNQGLFSWRDVSLVYQFAVAYSRRSVYDREFFQELIGIYGDPIDIAQGLYPPAGIVSSINFITGLAVGAGEHSTPSQAMKRGIQLAAEIGSMEVQDIRAISKMINSVIGSYGESDEGITQIRYRKTMKTDEVLDLFMEATENISKEGTETLKWIQDLLSIWPSGSTE